MERFFSLSALVLGVPYLFGYSYLSGYFGFFEITMGEAAMSQSEIYIGAFHGARRWLAAVAPGLGDDGVVGRVGAFVALALLAALTLRKAGLFRPRHLNPALWVFLGAWVVTLFLVTNIGARQGAAVAAADVPRLPLVEIIALDGKVPGESLVTSQWFTGGAGAPPPSLIHATGETAFLLMPMPPERGEPWVLRVSHDSARVVATVRKD